MIGHAWLEKDGVVYCAVLDCLQPAVDFYRKYDATPVQRYEAVAAARAASEAGHWGPWDAPKP
jgi:hypothetical protein